MGQVLQIGRMGESEAVFALLVSASLLLWHLGYMRGWRPVATWSIGFACAALAALVKGPQAPVYFVAITARLSRRTPRLALPHFVGNMRSGRRLRWRSSPPGRFRSTWRPICRSVTATWAGLATDRVHLAGLAKHFFTYPLETFACLLPWSPILVALVKPRNARSSSPTNGRWCRSWRSRSPSPIRRSGSSPGPEPLLHAALSARGRAGRPGDRALFASPRWAAIRAAPGISSCCSRRRSIGVISSARADSCEVGLGIVSAAVVQPRAVVDRRGGGVGTFGSATARARRARELVAVAAIAVFAGVAQAGAMINVNSPAGTIRRRPSPESSKSSAAAPLVSLTPIDHRFAYFYEQPIAELDWPRDAGRPAAGRRLLLLHAQPGRHGRRARSRPRPQLGPQTPGTLPFAWEEVATLCVERRLRDDPQRDRRAGPRRQAAASDRLRRHRTATQHQSHRRSSDDAGSPVSRRACRRLRYAACSADFCVEILSPPPHTPCPPSNPACSDDARAGTSRSMHGWHSSPSDKHVSRS